MGVAPFDALRRTGLRLVLMLDCHTTEDPIGSAVISAELSLGTALGLICLSLTRARRGMRQSSAEHSAALEVVPWTAYPLFPY